MRRLVGAMMLGLVVLGAAACGSDDGKADAAAPSSSAAAPSATAGGSDATKAACEEAVAMGEAAATLFTTKTDELKALAGDGENVDDAAMDAKVTEVETQIRGEFTKWTEKLTTLAATDVEAPVKAALTDGAATMTKLNSPDDQTPLGQVPTTLTGITTKIKTACA
ncbi:hypothetical protein Ais01nite_80520 [Asanoa ishikariensis]|uniref:Lipoprotein n=1 Tax=Asanoa ishikariensis TaxID=137265 RepID=A0A1H3UXX8_9ACTN|nr:hypothetical protein [Asanoa ishikariensis]GIF70017.1 hypothetical protein Ais01nite_80520 [Asanoa ishikariensis]SDZ67273.1 hypothetical protein SAMN05421684_8394 [Asanoa ishikariensis]